MAISQIIFFNPNAADFTNINAVLTATQGNEAVANLQRRSNNVGWMTNASVDSDDTTVTCDFNDLQTLTDIVLVNHNFKSFTVKYWDGSAYQDFSTPISETNSTDSTSNYNFNSVSTTKIQLIITGTQVANSDKRMNQLIATSRIGKLNGWPIIKTPVFGKNKRNNTMLSGKAFIGTNLGGFSCTLSVSNWSNAADLSVIETLYSAGQPFLVWLGGGIETQFSSSRQGYRKQDFFYMRCVNDYTPEWANGLYQTGLKLDIALAEALL